MRLVIWIESEIAKNDTLPPVARRFDNEIRLSHQQIAFLPFPAGTFRKPDSFSGEMIVEFGLGAGATPVAMCGTTGRKFRSFGIAQDFLGEVDQVPVVIEGHDLRLEMGVSKGGAEMFTDEDGLLLSGHPHAGIVRRNVARFVLGGNSKDGNAGGFVRLHEAHEVARKRREGRWKQRAAKHGTRGVTPSAMAPWAGCDLGIALDGERVAKDGKNVLAITIDSEVFH